MLFCSSTVATFLHCLKLSLIDFSEVIFSRFTPAIDPALLWHWKQYCLNVGSGFDLASATPAKIKKPVSVNLRQELWLSNIRFREIFIGDTDSKVGVFFKNHCLV